MSRTEVRFIGVNFAVTWSTPASFQSVSGLVIVSGMTSHVAGLRAGDGTAGGTELIVGAIGLLGVQCRFHDLRHTGPRQSFETRRKDVGDVRYRESAGRVDQSGLYTRSHRRTSSRGNSGYLDGRLDEAKEVLNYEKQCVADKGRAAGTHLARRDASSGHYESPILCRHPHGHRIQG